MKKKPSHQDIATWKLVTVTFLTKYHTRTAKALLINEEGWPFCVTLKPNTYFYGTGIVRHMKLNYHIDFFKKKTNASYLEVRLPVSSNPGQQQVMNRHSFRPNEIVWRIWAFLQCVIISCLIHSSCRFMQISNFRTSCYVIA